ncbi:MAG: hypothetical protein IH991_16330 [Planctomycetes bacterium]|nr:hypothetical protein [Planctomycetota bacterium]
MTWREDYAKEAFHDGKQAFRDGVEANPHPMGCFEHDAWGRGYEAAQDLGRLCRFTRMLEGVG